MNDASLRNMVRMLSVACIGLAVMTLLIAGYAYVVKTDNDRLRMVVEEVRLTASPAEIPQLEHRVNAGVLPAIEETEVPRPQTPEEERPAFFIESFDYRRLIDYSIEILDEGTPFGISVIDELTAFKLCVEAEERNYLITRLEEAYAVFFIGESPLEGIFSSRVAYGVQLVTHTFLEGVAGQVSRLRSSGYPAFIYRSPTEDGRVFYTVQLGAFPDSATARDYSDNLNVREVETITGWNISGRYVRRLR